MGGRDEIRRKPKASCKERTNAPVMTNTLTIEHQSEGKIEIIVLIGRLDAATSPILEKELNSMMDAGATRIIASMGGLEYISSSGLRVILAALKRLKKVNGDFILAEMTQPVNDVIVMTGFSRIFGVFPSVQSAKDSFRGA